jgi:GNAT superfamily N-acetyltransferase
MKIRPATWADAAILAEYNVALAQESENLALEPARVRKGVEAVLRDAGKGTYFTAEADGRVVGQLLVTHEWSDWRNGDFWWLQSVYVHPDFRSRGVFKALFNHAVDAARKDPQVCGLRLYVEEHNTRAREVYDRLGLKATGYVVMERLFV